MVAPNKGFGPIYGRGDFVKRCRGWVEMIPAPRADNAALGDRHPIEGRARKSRDVFCMVSRGTLIPPIPGGRGTSRGKGREDEQVVYIHKQ